MDEVTNTLEGLREEKNKKVIIWKVVRSLPTRFNPQVSVLEYRLDLNNLSMVELHNILIAYEMRAE